MSDNMEMLEKMQMELCDNKVLPTSDCSRQADTKVSIREMERLTNASFMLDSHIHIHSLRGNLAKLLEMHHQPLMPDPELALLFMLFVLERADPSWMLFRTSFPSFCAMRLF